MEKERATELACRQSLDISDWLEITDIPIGMCGNYSIGVDGVRFHPNGKKEDSKGHGWSEEQIREALPRYSDSLVLLESKADAQQRMMADNTSLLLLPCTPRQLVEFVLKRDVSGDLHGSLPGSFIAAVHELESSQKSCLSESGDMHRELEHCPALHEAVKAKQEIHKELGAGSAPIKKNRWVQKWRHQEQAVIDKLRELGHVPKALTPFRSGHKWVKSDVRAALADRTDLFSGGAFDKAWDRLRASGEIAEQD